MEQSEAEATRVKSNMNWPASECRSPPVMGLPAVAVREGCNLSRSCSRVRVRGRGRRAESRRLSCRRVTGHGEAPLDGPAASATRRDAGAVVLGPRMAVRQRLVHGHVSARSRPAAADAGNVSALGVDNCFVSGAC